MQILVVEDEARMAELLRSALIEEGHHVTAAFDGESGFQLAQAARFDVIVLDVMFAEVGWNRSGSALAG